MQLRNRKITSNDIECLIPNTLTHNGKKIHKKSGYKKHSQKGMSVVKKSLDLNMMELPSLPRKFEVHTTSISIKVCGHSFCKLEFTTKCCWCSDMRPKTAGYLMYKDNGKGDTMKGTRSMHYCPGCVNESVE